MGKVRVAPEPRTHTTRYKELRGADFSCDPSLVAPSRSPLPINLISAEGGNPVKRPGWRILHRLDPPVHNVWRVEIDGTVKMLAHSGTKLYELGENGSSVLKTGLNNGRGCGFSMAKGGNDRFYILTGAEYLVYDGTTVKDVREVAKVPMILISRSPSGGGTVLEAVNLLSDKREVGFLGNATDKVYILPDKGIASVDKVEYMPTATGAFVPATDYTADLAEGKIAFLNAKNPPVTGQDNVRVTYTKSVAGNYERIANCTIASLYGYYGLNTVFLSGNPEYRAYDWKSEVYDPTYVSDTSYSVVGTGDVAIMGYLKIGEAQAIVKRESQQEATVFLRIAEIENGKPTYRVRQGFIGDGAISKHCFANLKDEPMYLSRTGVHAITSTLIGLEKVVRGRSYFLDRKLLKEPNLDKAVGCEWNGYYMLAVNSKCYILDSRHKSYASSQGNSDFIYEAYYWEDFPAVCLLSHGGALYFGTSDGLVCKLNSDIEDITRYTDGAELVGGAWTGGKAIYAQWSTVNDDDAGPHLYKSLLKKGCCVTLGPEARSGCRVYYVVDGNPAIFVTRETMDIFSWEDIDFSRLTFSTNESPQEIYFNRKKKKYKRLQFIIVNDGLGEGFSLHELVKTYTIEGYSKRRG